MKRQTIKSGKGRLRRQVTRTVRKFDQPARRCLGWDGVVYWQPTGSKVRAGITQVG